MRQCKLDKTPVLCQAFLVAYKTDILRATDIGEKGVLYAFDIIS